MMSMLCYDILNNIFAWITDVRDILNLTRVCVDFYHAIYSSVVVIYSSPYKSLPCSFITKFTYLRHVSPLVIVKQHEDLMSLTRWLVYGIFDLVFTKDHPVEHITKAITFIKEQALYQPERRFYFGHSVHNNYTYNLMISQDAICYVGDEEDVLMTNSHDLSPTSLLLPFLPTKLPDTIQSFTYIVGNHEQDIPRLDTYLDRKSFSAIARNTDLANPSVIGYTRFGHRFHTFFTLRKYPHLQELDVPLSLQTFDRIIRENACFPNLERVGLLLEIISDEATIKTYLERYYLHLPSTIIIYATREDARYRVGHWQIPSLNIEVRYLAGIDDLERYV